MHLRVAGWFFSPERSYSNTDPSVSSGILRGLYMYLPLLSSAHTAFHSSAKVRQDMVGLAQSPLPKVSVSTGSAYLFLCSHWLSQGETRHGGTGPESLTQGLCLDRLSLPLPVLSLAQHLLHPWEWSLIWTPALA